MRKLDLLALKAVELLVREHAGHLTSTVGTEVEEDGRVALVNALVVGSEGLDELVAARVLLVVGLDTGNGVGISIGRVDHDVVGALDALPTIIAVHGPITARDGGNASVATGLLGDLSQESAELTHVTGTGLRVNVATIHEGVDANGLDTVLGSHLDQSLDVVHVRMNTARLIRPMRWRVLPSALTSSIALTKTSFLAMEPSLMALLMRESSWNTMRPAPMLR